jgi:hypothetical protein
MSTFNWKSFLTRWSREAIEAIDTSKLPPSVVKSGWLGYAGATEAQIMEAETRLKISFPPSYRAFLKVSNGWRQTTPFIHQLWSTAEIEWFSVKHQHWIDAFLKKSESPQSNENRSPSDEEYQVYGAAQDCSKLRGEYLQTALAISKRGEGAIYLLNPQVVNSEGEWEAWFFGDWLPGADRYRSFQEMMQAEYENFLELRESPDSSASRFSETEILQDNSVSPDVHNDDSWVSFASFTVEFQTRKGDRHSEQQTILHHLENDAVEILHNLEDRVRSSAIQQWMGQQLGEAKLEEPIELEINQLRVVRRAYVAQPATPMIVDKAHPLLPDVIQTHEPFTLEVSVNVMGASGEVGDRQMRAQCVAYNLETQLNTDLGDITTQISNPGSVALFPTMLLHQPGIYRLKVWVTLQDSSAAPSYFGTGSVG